MSPFWNLVVILIINIGFGVYIYFSYYRTFASDIPFWPVFSMTIIYWFLAIIGHIFFAAAIIDGSRNKKKENDAQLFDNA